MLSLFNLDGLTALVTGGGSGIGRAMAEALAGAGANVVVVGRREAPLHETVARIEHAGGRAAAFSADVSRLEAATVAQDAARAFGPPDILVNAAGINLRRPADEVTVSDWNRTLAVNLSAPFFLARAVVPAMREKRWGRIINIASLQSVRAFPDSAPYGASKAGICQSTRAMAEAWSRDGITCNAIAPGVFPTELTAPVFADEERREQLARQTAIGRNGRMEDLRGATIFFASRASDYITGQVLFVDGGYVAK